MPTNPRKHQLNSSLVYHIYNRSHGRVPIFNTKDDFNSFMGLMKRYSVLFNLRIYHWVIMSNHYHLLIELEEPERISAIMAGLSKAYSCYHHKKYAVSGFLWQGRFKLQPVQKEKYLLACGRYIERNPVKAGMVAEAYEYPYSSSRVYCLDEKDEITIKDPAFQEFGADASSRRDAYIKFLSNFDNEEENCFHDLEQPAGNTDFIKRLVKHNGRLFPRRRGRPPSIRIVA